MFEFLSIFVFYFGRSLISHSNLSCQIRLHSRINSLLWTQPPLGISQTRCPNPILTAFKGIVQKFNGNQSEAWNYFYSYYSKKLLYSHDFETSMELNHLITQTWLFIFYGFCQSEIPEFQKKHFRRFQLELPEIKTKFPQFSIHLSEVFYFHHELRFSSPSIRNYVKNKDFIDGGAWIGDSAFVLRKYTNKTILSYECDRKKIPALKFLFRNLSKPNHILVQKYLSNQNLVSNDINYSTIDSDVEIFNLKIGFIKLDIEGAALDALHGAIQTIKIHQPILVISIYHNEPELMGVPKFIEEIGGYSLEFHSQNPNPMSCGEIALLAYPTFLNK